MSEALSIEPGTLPRFDSETLALNNLLAVRPMLVAVNLPGGTATLRLALPPTDSESGPIGVRFAAGSDDLVVGVEPAGEEAVLPDAAAELTLEDLPPALSKALADVYLKPALEATLGEIGPISLISSREAIPEDWLRAGLWLCDEDDVVGPPAATLHLEPGLSEKLCAMLRTVEPSPGADIALAVPVLFSVGDVRLDPDALAALETGDVILLGGAAEDMTATMLAGTALRPIGVARLKDSCLMVADTVGDLEATMSEDDTAEVPSAASETGFVDELEVRILFSLGQVNVDIGTLRSLEPGFVFGLDRMPNGNVSLMVNGREIGEGELVSLDDSLGVRILRLNRRTDG
ncbi:MAG: type III secretion system cytoplasmic ring protein SctQ [Pseudomonadota bacterium]